MSIVGGARPRSPGGIHSPSAKPSTGFESGAFGGGDDCDCLGAVFVRIDGSDCEGVFFMRIDAGAGCFNLRDVGFVDVFRDR